MSDCTVQTHLNELNFYLFEWRTKYDPLMKTYEGVHPEGQIIAIFLTHSLDSLEYIYEQFSNHNA